jgi:hypothetical protein
MMEDMNLLLRFLLHISVSKWLCQAWWKSIISANSKHVYKAAPPPPPPPPVASSMQQQQQQPAVAVEEVSVKVDRCKTVCTSGLNLFLHFINSLHNFAVFKLQLTIWDELEGVASTLPSVYTGTGTATGATGTGATGTGAAVQSLQQLRVLLSHTVEDMLKLVKLLSVEFLPIVNAGVNALELWRVAVGTERNIELSRVLGKVGITGIVGSTSSTGSTAVPNNNIKVAGVSIGDTPEALLHTYMAAENAFRSVRAQIETMKVRVQLSCDVMNHDNNNNNGNDGASSSSSASSKQLMSRKVAEELKLYLF